MARLIRGILKQGRCFKPVRTAPVLIDDEGRFIVDKQETSQMLSLHFASAERGVVDSTSYSEQFEASFGHRK